MIMSPPKVIASRTQCTYRNESDRFQVIRIENDGLERTIAAGQVLEFWLIGIPISISIPMKQ
jgi:hypothetical protein